MMTNSSLTKFSSHIDLATHKRIAKGEFIEVEKLYEKRKLGPEGKKEEGRIDIINREGLKYLVAGDEKDTKVNNFKKWEQGFKVYVAIYSQANPHRAAEILQYVHTIHTASVSFHWDNVYYYDVMFRRFLGDNPQRSWAKIYQNLWSMAMRDPISSKLNNGGNQFNSKGRSGDWKDNYCWRFNKNRCKRSSQHCRYEHRCTYCDSASHGAVNCSRRRRSRSSDTSSSSHSDHHSSKKHKKQRSHGSGQGGGSGSQDQAEHD